MYIYIFICLRRIVDKKSHYNYNPNLTKHQRSCRPPVIIRNNNSALHNTLIPPHHPLLQATRFLPGLNFNLRLPWMSKTQSGWHFTNTVRTNENRTSNEGKTEESCYGPRLSPPVCRGLSRSEQPATAVSHTHVVFVYGFCFSHDPKILLFDRRVV